jgi:predicted nucleic acid-binding protein
MILVDTSVWIQHFRAGNDRLKALLLDGQVFCHPFVIGELACGTLQKTSGDTRYAEGLARSAFART